MQTVINTILFVSFVVNLVLGVVIYIKGRKQATNVLFALIGFSSAIWSVSLIGFYLSFDVFSIDVWLKVIHSVAISIAFFFLCFTVFFPRKIFSKLFLFFPFVIYAINLFYILTTDLIVKQGVGLEYEIGPLYIVYAASLVLLFLLGFVSLYAKIHKAQGENERHQIVYVLLGAILSSTLAIVPNLVLPYYGIFSLTWLGPIFTLIIVATIFIAILRYGLFDVKLIVTEIFIGVILVIVLTELVLAQDIYYLFLKSAVFIILLIFSFYLIKSINKEIKAREEIEKLAKDLRTANTRLNKISMLKTEFVSLATHQLRSPLTAIKGYVSMMLEGSYGPVNEQMKEPLERVFNSTGTLTQVVQDFLDVSRIEQGSMKYDMKAFSLKDLTEEIVNEQSPNIKRALLRFSFRFKEDDESGARYLVYGDRSKLKQVIANLIDNALKYTKSGFIKINLSYTNNTVILEVSDSGMGIDKKTLGVLFQKFERADQADEVNVQGTGLGLYIAKQIVEAHKGAIKAFSAGLGKGATFSVELQRKEF